MYYKTFISNNFKKYAFVLSAFVLMSLLLTNCSDTSTNTNDDTSSIIQFIYTSDSHYGITRSSFQGGANVDAHIVNAAMIAKINNMSTLTLPSDNGVNAGKAVGSIDYFIHTGDVANRMETGVQTASASWNQFSTDYLTGLTTKDKSNSKTTFFLVPGNHDVSNAIGYYKTMSPLTDATALVSIYNLMMKPATPKTVATYSYSTDKVNFSKDISGIHFQFVTMWPDSANRIWMNNDLKNVTTTPVIIFTHDQPEIETKHLTNPNGKHDINSTDKFENLVSEWLKDGTKTSDPSVIEQKSFTSFLKAHTNIKAYFHGNDNENKYYTYGGPDNDVALNVFQVDSPMKGNVSGDDETKLSFQLVTIDTKTMQMTVRECKWNTTPSVPNSAIVWGESKTISLK